jgi:hypothetical protein
VSQRLAAALAVILGLGSPLAFAQDAGRRSRSAEHAGREEAFKMVDAYTVSNLQESLALTNEQFVDVLPLVRKLQADRREFNLSRARALRRLRQLLASGSATGAQVVGQLNQIKALEEKGPARVRRRIEALDAALTPLQQAKYRVLEMDVEQHMRELMERARHLRSRSGGNDGDAHAFGGAPPR